MQTRIDSHHHLWHYTTEDYGWIDDSMHVLRRDFLPADLDREAASAGISGTIAVQARQTLAETAWLLSLAGTSPLLRGVIGWAPIAANDFQHSLEQLHSDPALKGLRHVVQGEPDGFLDLPDFNRGMDAMLPTGLVYDLLIFARQLPEATRCVDRHPGQSFVLDHIGKPDIRGGEFAVWDRNVRELARRPNVACKLSGMVTEADPENWTAAQLQPYAETVLSAFEPARLMFGSDWPVLNVGCTYARWVATVDAWIAPLSPSERAAIQGDTATRIYRLPS